MATNEPRFSVQITKPGNSHETVIVVRDSQSGRRSEPMPWARADELATWMNENYRDGDSHMAGWQS
jgi:hypothetical protein